MFPLSLPPGVVNVASKKAKSSNWREVNLMRWTRTKMGPVGGWEKLDYAAFASRPRVIHRWIANNGDVYKAYLCEQHCYVEKDGVMTDISPIPAITAPVSGDFAVGGYGDGLYGDGTYGTARAAFPREANFTPCYTLDNWGEDLLAMTSADGRLLKWSPGDTRLTSVTNAPEGNRSFAVTPERFVLLFGADSQPWKFQWSDQENNTVWTPGIANKAGSLPVEPRAPIVAHKKVLNGIIVWTTREVGMITYVGNPYYYSYNRIVESPTPMSAMSIAEIPQGVVFPSAGGFWLFNGSSIVPLDCPIWDWVNEKMNLVATKYSSVMVNVMARSELWWFFATQDGISQNDHYAMFNYRDPAWSMGKLARTAGMAWPNDLNPLMTDDQYIYRHESGTAYPGAVEQPWAETFTLNMEDGWSLTTIQQLLVEIEGDRSLLGVSFAKSMDPSNAAQEVYTPQKAIRSNGFVDVRQTARDFRMRIDQIAPGEWALGVVNVEATKRGGK